MAEAARRTVIIRGQVVDRYSPRRSIFEADVGETRSRAHGVSPGYGSLSAPERIDRPLRSAPDRPDRPLRSAPDRRDRALRSVSDRREHPQRPASERTERSRHPMSDRPERPRRPARYDARGSRASTRHRGPYDQALARPDRIALWAVLLGVILLLAAATSSHAAVVAHVVAR
jgi:hypothetical protein